MHDEDLLQFLDDAEPGPPPAVEPRESWRILIVDDDEEIHRATTFALRGVRLFDRGLRFDSAFSAAQAREMMAAHRYSCVLLDVVMEADDAGLELVGYIRDTLADRAVRIILRTGQPGYAPELDVVQRYDINDYKAKSELTSTRLITTLASALRSYEQIRTIEANRRGLEEIIGAASNLLAVQAVGRFSSGVLIQICSLLQTPDDGVVCVQSAVAGAGPARVLAGSGRFAAFRGLPVEEVGHSQLVADVERVLARRESFFAADRAALYIRSPRGEALCVHITTRKQLSDLDRKLLELFSINIAVGFDNAHLFEALEDLAYWDRLTRLPNRAAFEREIERRGAEDARFSLVVADIDNFQAVNDGLGHEIGDRTLQAAGAIMRAVFGQQSFIARISADTFALLHEGEQADLEARLRELARRLEHNIEIDGNEIPLSMSLGIARFPQHGAEPSVVFRNAGIALKQAKRVSRSSFQFFDDGLERALQRRLQTIRELRYSVERQCLKLFYQPQVTLASGEVFGVEALVRWQRSAQELVPPLSFIPAAEDSGLIVAMGEWILREACRQQQLWTRQTGRRLRMAVNVSMRQLKDPDFVPMLRGVLQETSVDPSMLELEVTESLMMEDTLGLSRVLQQVREMGTGVAIDDFGTGYSSLSHLQRLPIDRLKIDRAFITGLTERAEDQVIAALVINMGHLLHLRVIAEGVETPAQREQLLQMGCDDAQGYLFGRPMPAEDLAAKLLL
ncbi:putative bifunctional diguanylate cyclase/phosphodiesterase [Pseudomarimonas salicorniae]|uniref:EAL domain-containing protein n=1 Tax=Pseudomarimonas salicorniae TaxID=2933270 RepID=A0ABT0GHC1_9GAMM|nr:EAL domain-containing protein [Lysobacter sp. CAU 1642]MCK7593946.1 EAL domain-containing protein [Lysobacter sp. CAU 1642]